MAKIAAAAHAPFIAGASPTLMQMESWQELANPRDLTKIFTTPEYAALALAARDGGRQVHRPGDAALPGARCRTAPRPTRSRSSTSRKTSPAPTTASTSGPTRPTRWPPTSTARSSSTAGARASAASSRAARSEACRCTPSRPTTAASTMKCPTEIAITDRREAELAKAGCMPLIHARTPTSPPSSAPSRCTSRRSTTTRTPRPTPTWRAAALPVRQLPLRPLPQVHRARQDRLASRSATTWSAGSTTGS